MRRSRYWRTRTKNCVLLWTRRWTKSDTPTRRASACDLFSVFCEESDLDASLYRVDWVRQVISLFDDLQVGVHTAAWKAFDTLVKSVPKDKLEPLVVPLRRTIEGTGTPGRTVPGFNLPKGAAPTVSIIIAGLTTGSNEQRENAAYAIGDLVERTDKSATKPFVVPFTGPLIRVATQATTYPPGVKTAILSALTTMLERIPNHVKPFFAQLQRTFVKSVSDPSSIVVRTRAADALGGLMRSQPPVDPVVTELVGGARGSEEEIAASFVLALSHVVRSVVVHGGVGDKVRETCVELVHEVFRGTHQGRPGFLFFTSVDLTHSMTHMCIDHYIQVMAGLVASLSTNPQSLKSVVNAYLVSGTPPSALSSHTILAVLEPEDADGRVRADETLFGQLGVLRSVALKVKESAANQRPAILRPARDARELLKEMAADGGGKLGGDILSGSSRASTLPWCYLHCTGVTDCLSLSRLSFGRHL
ncbi:armadillo-type protein [Boletus coccyginus]|nr:armadillo-type protein [Boletus coccyginus]